jgi:SAM-dependent methyltransferase
MDDDFWDIYWESHLQTMENLGKQVAIQAASRLIRHLSKEVNHPLRLLELGSGEGQVIGTLLDSHKQLCDRNHSLGVDYNAQSVARCRKDYPGLRVDQADFTDPVILGNFGKFDILLLVNALHEVFSSTFDAELGEVDIPAAKINVLSALRGAVNCLEPSGWLVLFDGLEQTGNPSETSELHFLDPQARADFETFAKQYHPFNIQFTQLNNPMNVQLSRHSFTRYITKSIFLGKRLWQTEQLESYQYFTEQEFRTAIDQEGLLIKDLQTLTMNDEKWRSRVEIITPGIEFPDEHILILAQLSPGKSQKSII